MKKRFGSLLVILALVGVACGGDGASPSTEASVVTKPGATSAATTTTTTTTTTTSDTAAPKTTVEKTAGDYSFNAGFVLGDVDTELFQNWNGVFSIVGDQLVGSGTIAGGWDGFCSIGDGPQHPVVYTASGQFDITGIAGDSTMTVIVVPTGGSVDLTVGERGVLCVDFAVDTGELYLEAPLGNEELYVLPIEVPLTGGSTTLDFGDGFVIEVTVTAN